MTQSSESNKVCRVCKQTLPLTEFYKHAANKSGYENRCKTCNKAYQLAWARANREKRNLIEARYRSKPGVMRRKTLKQYNLTEAEFDALIVSQDNKCAICSTEFTSRAHVDHDHTTGKVRSLLCGSCNRGIGMFKDNPDLLKKAADYVLAHIVSGKHSLAYEKEVYDKLQDVKYREQ